MKRNVAFALVAGVLSLVFLFALFSTQRQDSASEARSFLKHTAESVRERKEQLTSSASCPANRFLAQHLLAVMNRSSHVHSSPSSSSSLDFTQQVSQLVDIVVFVDTSSSSSNSLSFLEPWRPFLEPHRVTILQSGAHSSNKAAALLGPPFLPVPQWLEFDLFAQQDADALSQTRDFPISNLPMMIPPLKKKFLFFIDDSVILRPSLRDDDDPLAEDPIVEHLRNMISPSSPFGSKTFAAMSAPTAASLVGFEHERVSTTAMAGESLLSWNKMKKTSNHHHHHHHRPSNSIVIPGMFDREKIGAALFQPPPQFLDHQSSPVPHPFSLFSLKVIADHLSLGVKIGGRFAFRDSTTEQSTASDLSELDLRAVEFSNLVQLNCTSSSSFSCHRSLASWIHRNLRSQSTWLLVTSISQWIQQQEKQQQQPTLLQPLRPTRSSSVELLRLVRNYTKRIESDSLMPQRDPALASGRLSPPATCITYRKRFERCIRLNEQRKRHQRGNDAATAAAAGEFTSALQNYFARRVSPNRPERRNNHHHHRHSSGDEAALFILPSKFEELLFGGWSDDFWVHTCSFLLESSSATRDAFILAKDPDAAHIPAEFRDFVVSSGESVMQQIYNKKLFQSVDVRSDLAANLFLQMHPRYNFCWVVKSHVRYVNSMGGSSYSSSWGGLFDASRAEANARAMPEDWPTWKATTASSTHIPTRSGDEPSSSPSSASSTPSASSAAPWMGPDQKDKKEISKLSPRSDNNKNKSHLIWFSSPIRNVGFYNFNASAEERKRQWRASSRYYIFGYRKALENRSWIAAHAPIFGISRHLASISAHEVSMLRGHPSHDAAMPLAALFYGLKVTALDEGIKNLLEGTQFYLFKPHRKPYADASAPMYLNWREGKVLDPALNVTRLAVGRIDQWVGYSCLQNFLAHPVYL